MNSIFEELDFESTPLGDISLRRRTEPKANNQLVYEVKLGDEFLMSSLFVEAEEQLSTLGLAALKANGYSQDLSIVVGGLGLGYTALEALKDSAVSSLTVVDVMEPVIRWHQQGILPIGNAVAADSRCELVLADFFELAKADIAGLATAGPAHAILLDIDHSPSHWLNQGNEGFYAVHSLEQLSHKLLKGGVFGIWSNEPADPEFVRRLESVFINVENHLVEFANPYTGGQSSNSVYLATKS